jgi:hypothetical protein
VLVREFEEKEERKKNEKGTKKGRRKTKKGRKRDEEKRKRNEKGTKRVSIADSCMEYEWDTSAGDLGEAQHFDRQD